MCDKVGDEGHKINYIEKIYNDEGDIIKEIDLVKKINASAVIRYDDADPNDLTPSTRKKRNNENNMIMKMPNIIYTCPNCSFARRIPSKQELGFKQIEMIIEPIEII